VDVVQLAGPAAGCTFALDDTLLDVHADFRQVAILAANVFLDKFVKQSLKDWCVMGAVHDSSLAFTFLVGVI